MASLQLCVLGEALMDCMALPDGNLRPLMGGSPFNLAIAAARQGIRVGYLNPFATDPFGIALREHLEGEGVRVLGEPSSCPTSLAIVQVNDGVPVYAFYRDGVADLDFDAPSVIQMLSAHAPGVLHTGSLMLLPQVVPAVRAICEAAKSHGWRISLDLNLRPKVAQDVQAYVDAVWSVVPLADWLKASDEDLQTLGWQDAAPATASEQARRLHQQGCERVVLTYGAEGAFMSIEGAQVFLPAPSVPVVDTVGAGDTLWGNCLAQWIRAPLAPVAPDETSLRRTLMRAVQAAAMNCEKMGCQPPTFEALNLALEQNGT